VVKGSVSYFLLKEQIKLDINCSEDERLVSRVKIPYYYSERTGMHTDGLPLSTDEETCLDTFF
jgi:hypothetical protein